MNFMTRLLCFFTLIFTTLMWERAVNTYDGLLSISNIMSLVATVALCLLFYYGFRTAERPSFWKAMMIVLTLTSLVTIWSLSGLTVVLALLVAFSVLSLGVLYDERMFGAFAVWWQTLTTNRQVRIERKQRERVPSWDSPELNRVPQEDHLTPVS